MCAEGTYSLGGVDACSACPEGETSDSGAKSADECFGKFGISSKFVLSLQTHCAKGESNKRVFAIVKEDKNTFDQQ